jgi:phosphonoacetaldehyde hydrolase
MKGNKIKLKKLKSTALIINITGILADCGWTYHRNAISEVFEERGIKLKDTYIVNTCGLPLNQQIRKIINNKNTLKEWIKQLKSKPNEDSINEISLAVNRKIISATDKEDYMIDEMVKRVNKLFKKGYIIALTSEYDRETSTVIENKLKSNKCNFHKLYTYNSYIAPFPHPFVCYQTAIDFNIFPMQTFLRVGDTQHHNLESFFAGTWSVSVLKTGVFSGLNKNRLKKRGILKIDKKSKSISKKLKKSGAHYTINTLDEIMWVIEDINYRLSRQELPSTLF